MKYDCSYKIWLFAGITVVSGATRKSDNASGAVNQQERSAQAEILRDYTPNLFETERRKFSSLDLWRKTGERESISSDGC